MDENSVCNVCIVSCAVCSVSVNSVCFEFKVSLEVVSYVRSDSTYEVIILLTWAFY